MKMYDSLETINFAHALMSGLDTDSDRDTFSEALRAKFDEKTTSEDGKYAVFKLTKKDVQEVFDVTFG